MDGDAHANQPLTLSSPTRVSPPPLTTTNTPRHDTHKDWNKHVRLTQDAEVAVDPRLRHCPKTKCDGVARLSTADLELIKDNSGRATRRFLARNKAGHYVEARCGACLHRFCAKCGGDAHPNDTCEAVGDAGFFRWKQKRAVKPCPSCAYQVRVRVRVRWDGMGWGGGMGATLHAFVL
jgi:primosomal protein N'